MESNDNSNYKERLKRRDKYLRREEKKEKKGKAILNQKSAQMFFEQRDSSLLNRGSVTGQFDPSYYAEGGNDNNGATGSPGQTQNPDPNSPG